MTDRQEALFRTFKPLLFGTLAALIIYGLIQLFTPMQLALGVATFVAICLLARFYEMNLDQVRKERNYEMNLDQVRKEREKA